MYRQVIDSNSNSERFYYINKPHQTRYEISISTPHRVLRIFDNTKGKVDYRTPSEFVYGVKMYDPKTSLYPNYVHEAVWMLEDHVSKITLKEN